MRALILVVRAGFLFWLVKSFFICWFGFEFSTVSSHTGFLAGYVLESRLGFGYSGQWRRLGFSRSVLWENDLSGGPLASTFLFGFQHIGASENNGFFLQVHFFYFPTYTEPRFALRGAFSVVPPFHVLDGRNWKVVTDYSLYSGELESNPAGPLCFSG